MSFLSTKQTYKYLTSMTLCYLDVIYTIINTMSINSFTIYENSRYDFWFEYLKRYIGRTMRDELFEQEHGKDDHEAQLNATSSTVLVPVHQKGNQFHISEGNLTHTQTLYRPKELSQDVISTLISSQDNESYIAGGQKQILQLFSNDTNHLYISTAPTLVNSRLDQLRTRISSKFYEREYSKQQYRRYYVHQQTQLHTPQDLSSIWLSLQEKESKLTKSRQSLEKATKYNPNDPLGEGNLDQDNDTIFVDSDFDEEVTIGRSAQRPEHIEASEAVLISHQNRQAMMATWMKSKTNQIHSKRDSLTMRESMNQPNSDNYHINSAPNDEKESNTVLLDEETDHMNLIDESKHECESNNQNTPTSPPFDPYLDDPTWISPPRFNNYVNDDDNPRPSSIEEQQVEKLLFFITPFLSLPSLEPIIINRVLSIINRCIMTMNYIGKLPHLYLAGHSLGSQQSRLVQSRRETLRHEYKQQLRSIAMHNGTYTPKKKNLFAGMVRSREGWDIDTNPHVDDAQQQSDLQNDFSHIEVNPTMIELELMLSQLRQSLSNSNHPDDQTNNSLFGTSEVVFIDTLIKYLMVKNNTTFLLPRHLIPSTSSRQELSSLSPLITSILPQELPNIPIHSRWDSRLLPLLASLWPSIKLLLLSNPRPTSITHSILAKHLPSVGALSFLPSTLQVLSSICTLAHGFFSQRFMNEVYPYLAQILTTQRVNLLNITKGQTIESSFTNSSPLRLIMSTLQLLKMLLFTAPSISKTLVTNAPLTDGNNPTTKITFIELILSFHSPLLPFKIQQLSADIIAVLMVYQRETVMAHLFNILSKIGIPTDVTVQLIQNDATKFKPNHRYDNPPSAPNQNHQSNPSSFIHHPLHHNLRQLQTSSVLLQQTAYHEDANLDKFSRREAMMAFWGTTLSYSSAQLNPLIGGGGGGELDQFEINSVQNAQASTQVIESPADDNSPLAAFTAKYLQSISHPFLPESLQSMTISSISSILKLIASPSP
jgi:hypothetical protein